MPPRNNAERLPGGVALRGAQRCGPGARGALCRLPVGAGRG
nr:hypothetical protein [Cystobacter sp.]